MQGQSGFWDVEDRLKELSAEGDPLENLAATVDFEIFRPVLKEALGRSVGGKGGRPASTSSSASPFTDSVLLIFSPPYVERRTLPPFTCIVNKCFSTAGNAVV